MAYLSKEVKVEAGELLEKLFAFNKEKVELELLKKEREENLKREIAEICNIRDKEGQALSSKIKMPLVVNLINELYLEKPNKKEEEYELMETYKTAFSSINQDVINAYLAINDSLSENAMNVKEAIKDTTLLSKEILDAILMVSKEQYKELVEIQNEALGIEAKAPKDDSQTLDIVKELKALIATLQQEVKEDDE